MDILPVPNSHGTQRSLHCHRFGDPQSYFFLQQGVGIWYGNLGTKEGGPSRDRVPSASPLDASGGPSAVSVVS